MSREAIDYHAGLPSGYAGKLLSPSQVKKFGTMSLGLMIETLGLVLVIVEDPKRRVRPLERRDNAKAHGGAAHWRNRKQEGKR